MLEEFGRAGFLLIFALAFPLIPIVASVAFGFLKIRPKRPDPIKEDTYECGVETEQGDAWGQFNIRYYIVALLFVVFDVEVVFLYPWAVAFKQLGLFAFVEAVLFIGILLVGYLYAWRRRALEWV
jgi:NADH:ubiquinone oxidoreductase subunit 3 (subunit A)